MIALTIQYTTPPSIRSHCIVQGISFFQLNPRLRSLRQVKPTANMILQTRKEMN